MSGDYVIARENFKEAEKHVSAETNPVMFNLLYGLQSLTDQIEADFTILRTALASLRAPAVKTPQKRKPQTKKSNTKKVQSKKARTGTSRRSR